MLLLISSLVMVLRRVRSDTPADFFFRSPSLQSACYSQHWSPVLGKCLGVRSPLRPWPSSLPVLMRLLPLQRFRLPPDLPASPSCPLSWRVPVRRDKNRLISGMSRGCCCYRPYWLRVPECTATTQERGLADSTARCCVWDTKYERVVWVNTAQS